MKASETRPAHTASRGPLLHCDVAYDDDGDGACVRARGELDMATAPRLAAEIAQLLATGCSTLTIDLSEVTFADCTGMRFLLECSAAGRRDGHTITLIPGPPAMQRVFELTGTTAHLPFIASRRAGG